MAVQATQNQASVVLPGPTKYFPLGNLREFNRDSLHFMLEQREYGDLSKFHFGPFPVVVTGDPDLVHEILVTNAALYKRAAVTKYMLEPVLGQGLFTSEGELWKRQRRLIQPIFHTKYIGVYARSIVRYASDMLDQWQSGTECDVDQEMTALTLRIIAKTLFDADLSNDLTDTGRTIRDAIKLIGERSRTLIPIPRWLPTRANLHMNAVIAKLDALIQGFIDQRHVEGDSVERGDLLSLLLAARDEDGNPMSDKQVRDEAMTFFGAGHETTAVTLMWAWYLLAQNPAAEAKLHAELDQVLSGKAPSLDDLNRLPYTEMVIKETMRLYPAAWIFTREPLQDVVLRGCPIHRTQTIMLNVYGMQRDGRYFPDPERFDPDRFSPDNEKNIPKYAYLPFGAGPRVCIGNAFAMMEARLTLATIAQRYRLELAPDARVVPEALFTLRTKYGMRMIPRLRQKVMPIAAPAEVAAR